MSDKLEDIEAIITPVLEYESVSLEHMEYVKEGEDYYLRLYIDKPGGVDLVICSRVSEKISELLDAKDPFNVPYYLEVSSPGAEKPLKTKEDIANHVGEYVYVSLYVHIGDEKEYTGTLLDFTDDMLTIEYKWKHTTNQVQIPFDKIAKARLAVML